MTDSLVLTGANKEYYLNGKLHRINVPAIEYFDGTKEYYLNGKLHRINVPAIERANGS
jgi:antitoxin component YwqK of YwqJK toxin-antitoxin module